MRTIEEITEIIKRDSLISKYLADHWISGSSTLVYPISVSKNNITIQISTQKSVFKNCINRILKASEGLLSDGLFNRGDGSCPATLCFFFSEEFMKNFIVVKSDELTYELTELGKQALKKHKIQ